MNVIHGSEELAGVRGKRAVAIGVFDGVHLGHQQVVRQAVQDARQHEGVSIVITFNRHPSAVVTPGREPKLIYSLSQKLRALGRLEVDFSWVIPFDLEFSRLPAEEFIRRLAADFSPFQSVCVGARFTFGHKRSGDVSLLGRLGQELGFVVHGIPSVALDDQPVSSTRIRELVAKGDLDAAGQMLGRSYSLSGFVRQGDQLGRSLGWPTANIDAAGLVLPPFGVYAAHAQLGDQTFRAAVNVGRRPTVNSPNPQTRVEAHLIDFTGNLYGQELDITFVQKIRGELTFPSLDALREQITQDVQTIRGFFSQ